MNKPMMKSMNKPMNKTMQIPHSHATNWILAYDIREPRRLQKVGRLMQKEGMRLQYSVYMLKGSRDQVEQLLEQLTPLIDAKADDVKIYPLGENTRIWGLGTQFSDGGNMLCDDFLNKVLVNVHPEEKTFSQALTRLDF